MKYKILITGLFFILNVYSAASAAALRVSPKNLCFEDVIGMREVPFVQELRDSRYVPTFSLGASFSNPEDAATRYYMINKRGANPPKEWCAGFFKTCSVRELEQAAHYLALGDLDGENDLVPSQFNVVVGFNTANLPPARKRLVDVAALQADPAHRGAVFQVASTFNCLEGGARSVAGYIGPRMPQGQSAAISALPGTIQRMYCKEPINLLQDVPELGRLVRGHSLMLTQAQALAAAGFDYRNVRVGIQLDTDVAFGLADDANHEVCMHPDQHVTQVYTSALNMGINPGNGAPAQQIARKLLSAAYEGTIYAAFLEGQQRLGENPRDRQEVFLTLVGGGIFGNNLAWIADAIYDAVTIAMGFPGLDITLVVYDAGNSREMMQLLQRMQRLSQDTGGAYTEIRRV